jgi:cytochrome P450
VDFDPGRNARVAEALDSINQFVYRIIDDRIRADHKPNDLLSVLLAARHDSALNRRQLRDEVVTMLISGHETTALILSWTWYLLSQDPEVEDRLIDEVDRVLAGRMPDVDDLPRLPYCRMVLDESMRLYPPVWYIIRQTIRDDEVGGVRLPARSTVVVSPYVVHRHPSYWEDAERFDPERFQPERCAARPRYAHLPFGGGKHTCLGNHFALMEGVIAIARVLQRFRVRLVPGQLVEPHPVLTLRQRYGLQATVQPRSPTT